MHPSHAYLKNADRNVTGPFAGINYMNTRSSKIIQQTTIQWKASDYEPWETTKVLFQWSGARFFQHDMHH